MARISLRRLGERADLSVPRGSPQMGARYDADAFGRFAEGMARFLGTGRFIVGQTVLVVAWIILNTIGAIKHWDPYPFILLNLAFSTQAAYAAPLILLAQNRQDDRDRANIERDREVAARTQADTEFLARELAAARLALADMVTTQDLEDSLSRLAKLIAGQPLPDGQGPLTPSDTELPRLRFSIGDSLNDWKRLMQMILSRELTPEQVITYRLPLRDAATAYHVFDTRAATKVVLLSRVV